MTEIPHDFLMQLMDGVTPETRSQCETVVDASIATCEQHYGRSFERPVLKFDLKGRVAGYAHSHETPPVIRINTDFLDNSHRDDMFADTIPHEVAHIVAYQINPYAKSHGWQWADVMRVLGLQPNRCHSYTEITPARKTTRYGYTCGECGVNISFGPTIYRRGTLEGRRYFCRNCKTPLDFDRAVRREQ